MYTPYTVVELSIFLTIRLHQFKQVFCYYYNLYARGAKGVTVSKLSSEHQL